MVDAEAIRSLIVRQKRVGDAEDAEATRSCWATNATLTIHRDGSEPIVIKGRDNIVTYTVSVWKNGGHRDGEHASIHFGGPAEIEAIEPDRAVARSTCLYVSAAPDHRIMGFGRYTDEVVLEGGKWRLLSRQLRVTF